MSELLLEVGCEELPASFVEKAYGDLLGHLEGALKEAGVYTSEGSALGTPRRLIVRVPNVLERQPDREEERRGPSLQAAYDADGNPTKALEGFCRGQGITPGQLRKDDKYVWADVTIKGKDTKELLTEILPKAIRSLNFEKSMRWGQTRMRFARPIRWILASFDGNVVSFDVEGVQSGLESRGHRFYFPEPFTAKSFDELMKGLRERKVEPDGDKRKERILEGAKAVAGGSVRLDEALVDENVFLTEWPEAQQGTFSDEYLSLPEPVLVTAMAKHERMFPVEEAGKITNKFVAIRNSGEEATVRSGNEWVLNARFNDARFFYEEDKKASLKEFLEQTEHIVFADKLGTVRQRADRLSKLAAEITRATGGDQQEIDFAAEAGLYCKADLSTGLVSELASLQGIIGGEYAKREDMHAAVCWAIATQYDLSKNPNPNTKEGKTAVRVIMADQIDKLAGYLGHGLEPSGSSDPYGLRRAATLLIEAAWSWPEPIPGYAGLLDYAVGLYKEQGIELDESKVVPAAARIFEARYSALIPDARYDLLDAAVRAENAQETLVPRSVRLRLECQNKAVEDIEFVQTATRPLNILTAARKKQIAIGGSLSDAKSSADRLDSGEGTQLLEVSEGITEALAQAIKQENAGEVISQLKKLEVPINVFFDSTMVMADDENIRYGRLTLLNVVADLLLQAGDFTKVVVEGKAENAAVAR